MANKTYRRGRNQRRGRGRTQRRARARSQRGGTRTGPCWQCLQ
jgi:hypothetical protein